MIENLYSYFLPEQQYFLQNANFEHIETSASDAKKYSNIQLTCNDNLSVNLNLQADIVKILLTRYVSFAPDLFFHASVTYGAILKFNEKKSEVDWEAIDLANQLLNNGQFVTNNLMSRISLLLGEMTSSSGQTPLMLPPQLITKPSQND